MWKAHPDFSSSFRKTQHPSLIPIKCVATSPLCLAALTTLSYSGEENRLIIHWKGNTWWVLGSLFCRVQRNWTTPVDSLQFYLALRLCPVGAFTQLCCSVARLSSTKPNMLMELCCFEGLPGVNGSWMVILIINALCLACEHGRILYCTWGSWVSEETPHISYLTSTHDADLCPSGSQQWLRSLFHINVLLLKNTEYEFPYFLIKCALGLYIHWLLTLASLPGP